jgi:hypothetical protein
MLRNSTGLESHRLSPQILPLMPAWNKKILSASLQNINDWRENRKTAYICRQSRTHGSYIIVLNQTTLAT